MASVKMPAKTMLRTCAGIFVGSLVDIAQRTKSGVQSQAGSSTTDKVSNKTSLSAQITPSPTYRILIPDERKAFKKLQLFGGFRRFSKNPQKAAPFHGTVTNQGCDNADLTRFLTLNQTSFQRGPYSRF